MFLFWFGISSFFLLSLWSMTWYVMGNRILLGELIGECYRWPVTLSPPGHLLTVSNERNSHKPLIAMKETSYVSLPVSAPVYTCLPY